MPVFAVADVQPKEPVRFYVESNAAQVAPESEIIINVYIDSATPVNAFEIELFYPQSLLKPVLLKDGNSIVDLWQKRQWEAGDGAIQLSGGMIKPFSGKRGIIAELRFKALSEGAAQISFSGAKAYYADGSGTGAQVKTEPVKITIDSKAPLLDLQEENDTTLPVFEFLQVTKNPSNKGYLVVFQVKDKMSGVKSVLLRSIKWVNFGEWAQVSNPAEISEGVWIYQISAVDNNGNTLTKTMYITEEIVKKLLIIFLAISVLAGSFYGIIKKWFLVKK